MRLVRSRSAVAAFTGTAAVALVWACAQGNPSALDNVGVNGPGGGSCAIPATGCACGAEGASTECSDVLSRSAQSVTCVVGTRTCRDGAWSTCAGKTSIKGAGLSMSGGTHLTDLQGQPTQCQDDPCDPNCTSYVDNGTGVDAGGGLTITDAGGVTLQPIDGSVCSGTQTTISGTVYDPAGNNPIYGAYVYIPSTPVAAFTPGVGADKCGGGGTLTGTPVSIAVTDANGKFTLVNPPTSANVPVVIQIGRWRRQVTVASVNPCGDNPMPATDTHLPRKQSEGDIPYFGYVSGGADYLECLMDQIGIDPSEFTAPGGGGRVAFYQGWGGMPLASGPTQWFDQLLGSPSTLSQYDVVMLSCMGGSEYGSNPSGSVTAATAHQNLQDYMAIGGRMFTSHWGREWIEDGPTPAFAGAANWTCDGCTSYGWASPLSVYVDTSTVKGMALGNWLSNVGVSNPFSENPSRFDVSSVIAPSIAWLNAYSDNDSSHGTYDNVPDLSFNTPIGIPQKDQVGRVVYADTHVGQNAVTTTNAYQFPDYCTGGPMDAQEKALEFLFFDLAACVSPVNQPLLPLYPNPAVFTRDYEGVCAAGKTPVWREFGWGTSTPEDSNIVFAAQTADTQGGLTGATSVGLGTASGADQTPYTLVYVDPILATIPSKSKQWLRITMTLNPSSDHFYAPTVNAWEQLYDCVDSL